MADSCTTGVKILPAGRIRLGGEVVGDARGGGNSGGQPGMFFFNRLLGHSVAGQALIQISDAG